MTWSHFNGVDAVAGVLLLITTIGGVRRGLAGELLRFAGLLLSGFLAWKLMDSATGLLPDRASLTDRQAAIVAFIAIFVAAALLCWGLRILLKHLLEFKFRGRVEQIGGGLFGLGRGAVLVTVIVLITSLAPHDRLQSAVTEGSFVGRQVTRHVLPLYEDVRGRVPLPLPDVRPGAVAAEPEAEAAAGPEAEITNTTDEAAAPATMGGDPPADR